MRGEAIYSPSRLFSKGSGLLETRPSSLPWASPESFLLSIPIAVPGRIVRANVPNDKHE